MSRALTVCACVVVAVLGGTAGYFHRANHELEGRIEELTERRAAPAAQRAVHARAEAMRPAPSPAPKPSPEAVRAEIAQAKQEIASLEARAARQHAELLERTARTKEELATNRDPEHGLVRPENFEASGNDTPKNAFRTLVWSAVNADTPRLSEIVSITPDARAKLQAILQDLPAKSGDGWTLPKLVTLHFGRLVTDVSGVAFTSETYSDPAHATITVRIPELPDEKGKMDFVREADGWHAVLDLTQAQMLQRQIARAPVPSRTR